MKLRDTYKCPGCDKVVPLEEALQPPSGDEPAQPIPCSCGRSDWVPVKPPRHV